MTRRPLLAASALVLALTSLPAPVPAAEPDVRSVSHDAPSVGRTMTYQIAFPAGYGTSGEKRYPVLYLLHGLTSNYLAWANLGAAKSADGLDLIVVMPDAGNSWYANWAESAEGQKNAWEDYIIKDLIGHVDATYRTIPTREGRAINGLSMGGYGALMLGLRHPDMFCSIGSHSGALGFARSAGERIRSGRPAPERPAPKDDRPNPRIATEGFRSQGERTPKGKLFVKPEDADAYDLFKLVLAVPKDKLPHVVLDCGTEDRLIGANREFARLLMENNIPFVFGQSPGGHVPAYWSREVRTSMAIQSSILRRNLAAKQAAPKGSEESKPRTAEPAKAS
jgi:S-formylglutathione hydrolase FrmB